MTEILEHAEADHTDTVEWLLAGRAPDADSQAAVTAANLVSSGHETLGRRVWRAMKQAWSRWGSYLLLALMLVCFISAMPLGWYGHYSAGLAMLGCAWLFGAVLMPELAGYGIALASIILMVSVVVLGSLGRLPTAQAVPSVDRLAVHAVAHSAVQARRAPLANVPQAQAPQAAP